MNLQETPFTCGPASLCNAVKALGATPIPEKTVAELCGTTPRGTNATQLLRGARKLGLRPESFKRYSPESAYRALSGALLQGLPVVCSVDQDDHWVTAIGLLGSDRVLVADSASGDVVLSYTKASFLDRWQGSARGKVLWYGVICWPSC